MKIVDQTPFCSGWTQGFAPNGREVVVVAVRGTYILGLRGMDAPLLADEQLPPLEADVFGDDPARDAPRYENDYGLFKPRCDVLLNAHAHAPGGRPTKRVTVGVRVASSEKSFDVVGPRVWLAGQLGGVSASPSVAFVRQEISYDVAFGGTDIDADDPSRIRAYAHNPCGAGFCHFAKNLDRLPLSVTEEIGAPVTRPTGSYRPMAFGSIGRNWVPRYGYAGTYDQRWQDHKLPFLPDDFDYQYFQAAPLDQQIPYPRGGEPIVLVNLTSSGRLVTKIPEQEVAVIFVRRSGESVTTTANLDTVLIEPELDRLTLVWRACCAMKRDAFELKEMVVIEPSRSALARERARQRGKTFYPSLGELVHDRKGGR